MMYLKYQWKPLFSSLLVMLASTTLIHADIIAEESFTYANGNLTGRNGGSGFIGAWTSAINDGLEVQNNVAVFDSNVAEGNFRAMTPFGNVGEVWLSFDLGDSSGSNAFAGLSFMSNDNFGPSGGNEKVLIGTRGGADVWNISLPAGGDSIVQSNVPIAVARKGVLKVSLGVGATSSIELWVGNNTVDLVDVSGVPDVTFNGAWLQDVNRIRVAAGRNSDMTFDNLVIGQTASDVGATGGSLDSDDDGLNDEEEELITLTEPDNPDTDGDGAIDGLEVILGFDPLSDSSVPPSDFDLIDLDDPGTIGRYLNNNLPETSPGTLSGGNWQNEDYYTGQGNFSDLIGVVAEPRSDYVAVVEIQGTIQRVNASNRNTTQRTQVLDIQSITGGGRRVRGVAFHPNFNLPGAVGENYLYVFYQATSDADIDGFTPPFDSSNTFRRVSRFTRNPATGEFDIGTELILIQQVSSQGEDHPGGGLTFGKDGFLHIGFGDFESTGTETAAQPLYQDSQRIDRIFQSAILRIDVDMIGGTVSHAPTVTLQGSTGPNAVAGSSQSCPTDHAYYHHDNISGVGYFIPSDNYWVQNPPAPGVAEISPSYPAHGAALEEHQAVGLRNP